MKYAVGWISLLAVMVMLFSACAPRRTIYIPPEWHTPAPPVRPTPPPAPPKAKNSVTPPGGSSPIFKPPPTITEKDVPVGSESIGPPAAKKPPPPPPPQHLASMHLVEQAKAALTQGKSDAAISLLEQAIQVDVYNGEAFFLLARAWRMKGSRNKAMEFTKKAEVLLNEDKEKLKDVYLFQAELYKEMGDSGKAEQYRQKASKP